MKHALLWSVMFFGAVLGHGTEIDRLQTELAAAQQAQDKPSIIELSRRITLADPQNAAAWRTLIQTQLLSEDAPRAAATLAAWENVARPPSSLIADLRGDLAKARKQPEVAEKFWLQHLTADPGAVETLRKLADLCAGQDRWREANGFLTRLLQLQDNAANRVQRARSFVYLRAWNKASLDLAKANALDPADAALKTFLPQFELLTKSLPQIRILDAKIAVAPGDPMLKLERAHLFTLTNRPELALQDCREVPVSEGMRARIQTGEALLDLGREEEAVRLQVSRNLVRAENKHVDGEILRELGACDLQVWQHPAESLPARAKELRRLNQPVLALADAEEALRLDPKSAAAHFQAAHALDALDRGAAALRQCARATELAPKDPVMWYYRGLLEAQRANFADAIRFHTRSLELRESLVALQERSKCERRLGRVQEAEADAIRVQQLAPE